MKIGVLTLPLNTNYGGILQAYALQTILERMGHEACIISIKNIFPATIIGRLREYFLSPIKQWILRNIIPADFVNDKSYYTSIFIRKYVNTTYYHSFSEIKPNEYDAIIVGSDQIWREKYVCGSHKRPIESSFLDFAESWNIKRLSYAASFGTDSWEYSEEQTNNCRRLIHKFDAVSVRESSGIALCEKHLGIDSVQVLDPTLLLTKEDYCDLVKKCSPKASRCLMTYILDPDTGKERIIELLVKALGLKIFRANEEGVDSPAFQGKMKQPPVENWICGFRDADFVVTDSFHACVFSLIFNKPFVVIPNYVRGASRFESLLSLFGQSFRLVKDPANFVLDDRIKSRPNCNLQTLRDFSLNFLISNL